MGPRFVELLSQVFLTVMAVEFCKGISLRHGLTLFVAVHQVLAVRGCFPPVIVHLALLLFHLPLLSHPMSLLEIHQLTCPSISGWWFQMFFIFTPKIWGRWTPFMMSIFFNWVVQPPTRYCLWGICIPLSLALRCFFTGLCSWTLLCSPWGQGPGGSLEAPILADVSMSHYAGQIGCYCWWFRNPKQPLEMYETRRK